MRGPGVIGCVLALAIVVGGCGGAMPASGVTLDVGTAQLDGTGFLPLAGNQTLVAGAQGGFHVWVTYRIKGMKATTLDVHRTTHRKSDDALVLLTDGTIDVGAPGPDGWWQLDKALPNFICPTPIGIDVIGQDLIFEVEPHDDSGKMIASSSAEATVECPGGSDASLCASICSG